jgi:hypothetical protein
MQLLLLGLMLAFISFSAVAGDCRIDKSDPYEVDAKIIQGKFKGQCLDTKSVRSYRLLDQKIINQYNVLKHAQNKGALFAANFFHAGKFYIAAINPSHLKNIIFQIERFPPEWLAAHTQLRFTFDSAQAISLYDQKNPEKILFNLSEMVLSVEAAFMRQGPNYDLWKGMHGYFGMAHRLVSLEQRYQESVAQYGHKVEQILLSPHEKLIANNPQWRSELLLSMLMELDRPAMNSLYHTLKVNCTNTLFRALDKYFNYEKEAGSGLSATWPIFSQHALKKRRLIQGVSFYQTLNREFPQGPEK